MLVIIYNGSNLVHVLFTLKFKTMLTFTEIIVSIASICVMYTFLIIDDARRNH